jgi:hypothetical protein
MTTHELAFPPHNRALMSELFLNCKNSQSL